MIHLGIMGCGAIAHAIAQAASVVPNVTLYAVASRSFDKAVTFNNKYQAPNVYGSYEAMLEDEHVDLVYIATPHGLHHTHVKMCLDHNKHVLCEKAFTLNAALAIPLFTLAKEKGLFLMEAMWTKFLPSTAMIEDILHAKLLGKIQKVSIDFGFTPEYNIESRLWNPFLGGGVLLDIGVYPLTMLYHWFGVPKSIESAMTFAPNGVDQDVMITCEYPTFTATLHASFVQSLAPNALSIEGVHETLESKQFWMSQEVLLKNADEIFEQPFVMNGYEYELFEAVTMIELGQSEHPYHTHQMTLNILKVMDDIRSKHVFKYPIETDK